jgi:hypothetical protein
MKLLRFFILFLWVIFIFALLDPDPADQNRGGSMQIRIRKTKETFCE